MRVYRKYIVVFIIGVTVGYTFIPVFYILFGFHSATTCHLVNNYGNYDGVFNNKHYPSKYIFHSSAAIHIYAENYLNLMPNLNKIRGDFLDPIVLLGNKMHVIRSPPQLVIGIPTTHRNEVNYLSDTLRSLFMNLALEEQYVVKFVVLIAERQIHEPLIAEFIVNTTTDIQNTFPRQLRDGLIEVIVPPAVWYPPDLEVIKPTFNDSQERMLWRTKQNLDYAYLMMYINHFYTNAKYYMQLEDDVSTLPRYVSGILNFVEEKSGWITCEFCTLGFIGKLIRQSDLIVFINFILFNYREYPVDWILDELFRLKYCHLVSTSGKCTAKEINRKLRIQRNPPLFQHKGHFSSLDGKVQTLKVLGFEKKNKLIMLRESRNPEPVRFAHNLPTTYDSNFNKTETALENFYRRFTPFTIIFESDRHEISYENFFLEINLPSGCISSGIEILFFYSIKDWNLLKHSSDDLRQKIPFHVSICCDYPLKILEEEYHAANGKINKSTSKADGFEDCFKTKLANFFLDSRSIPSKFYHKFKHKIKIKKLSITFNLEFAVKEMVFTMLKIMP